MKMLRKPDEESIKYWQHVPCVTCLSRLHHKKAHEGSLLDCQGERSTVEVELNER